MTAYAGLADPPRVGGRWISLLSVANLGLWVGYYAPLQVLLPLQAEQVAGADKATALGVITGVGALVAVVAGPVAGALSDATTARTGRRHTWTVVGALISLVGLILLSGQHTLLGLTLCWCLAQAGLNLLQAGITAIVPDRTPVAQRGSVSGWVGLAQSSGVVLGVLLVTAVVSGMSAGYLLTGVVVVLAAVPFVLLTRDPPVAAELAPRFTVRSVLSGFRFAAGEAPDFAWAWATRFLVQLGNAMATLYLLYFLRDQIHHPDAEQGVLLLVLVYTAGILLTVVAGGVVSDRTGRRKPSVILSGYVMAAAALLLALWPTWPGAIVAAALLGLGFGVYLSVDQALITQVLPGARDRARDLGIINIANSAPQVLGPALAFPIVAYLGGYPALFLSVAAVTLLGSVLVTRIRSVP
ncbi:MFS transporter [Couchioplanes caeruleus]|uniref:MFS-type transporter involved in bile tolerance (Atg22 family) n=1 Tax=Couchioplanes caeruleus TaxID=56438 RepID=A0A3N1GF53_9ACTN|nr:MFS transporter [Couchioplanes caeruleus]ROP28835.1 MFS-type transporter involved in bile tolerance (Atg22 family) [Couchioplanes caeruleus]